MPISEAARGVTAMLASALCVATMAALVRVAASSYGIDAYKMSVFRFAIGMALVGIVAMARSGEMRFLLGWKLLARGLFGGIGVVTFFLGVAHLGIARGTIISYSTPIFSTIFGVLILKEYVGPLRWFAVALGFAGIVMITIDPAALRESTGVAWIWYAVALCGAISGSLAVILVRQLRHSNKPTEIFFSQCVVGFWLTLIPANLKPVEMSVDGGLLLLAIGVAAAVAQILMTYSYARVTVATGGVLTMTVPMLTMAIGVLMFDEPVTARVIVGSATVVASCTLVAMPRRAVIATIPQVEQAPI